MFLTLRKEKQIMNISISKQQLGALPSAQYSGRIVVVENPDDAETAVAELRKADLIGFDTETRPAFKKGQNYKVALVQLATHDTCYLFRLNKIGFPLSLQTLLQDRGPIKVGLSIHDDFRNLRKWADIEPGGFVELQQYATRWNISDKSLSKLYGILFGQRLSKTQRLTNWEADTLTAAQQHYAALDAMACLRIYEFLRDGNFNPALSQYRVENETGS